MKILTLIALLIPLLLAGCFDPGRDATLASAERYVDALMKQLGTSGSVENHGSGRGQAGNAFSNQYFVSLPSSSFKPGEIGKAAVVAKDRWGEFGSYSSRGEGGGGNRYRLRYGSGKSHAFIDVVAYPDEEMTRIDINVRVVE